MEAHDLIRRIPTSLSANILHTWIDFKTLKSFDSACCNLSSRAELITLIRSEEISLYERMILKSEERIKLVATRSLQPRIILLGVGDDDNLAQSYTEKFPQLVGQLITRGYCTQYIADIATQCHNLTYLELGNSSLNSSMLRDLLLGNPHLEELRVLTESSPYPPSFEDVHLPRLTSLTIWYSKNMVVDILKTTKGVSKLHLCHAVLSYQELREVALLCPNMQALGLSDIGFKVTDETLAWFAQMCPYIEHLDISNNARLTDAGLLGVLKNLKCVRSLNIQHCYSLTDEILGHIITYCADTLHTLYLNASDDGPVYAHDELDALFERCTHLRTLGWAQYTAGQCSPYAFTSAISSLTTIVLQQDCITDANLITIATHCVNLKRLSIVYIDAVDTIPFTRAGLKALVFGCNSLQEVALSTYVDNFYSDKSVPHPGVELAVDLWKQLRPQLVVHEASNLLDCFRFDVRLFSD